MKPGPAIWKGAVAGGAVGIGMGLLMPGVSAGQSIVGGMITGALVTTVVRFI